MGMTKGEQARKFLIDHALNGIINTPTYSNFYTNMYYVIAKLGLQREAKQEELLETIDWNDRKMRNEIIDRIKHFLIKYIK